jgi:Shedu protein SduA, C-terminal/Restriction endonuclease XhoI
MSTSVPSMSKTLGEAHANARLEDRRGWQGRLVEALVEDLNRVGVDRDAVRRDVPASSDAGYRLRSWAWDLVVLHEGLPSAVIELNEITLTNNLQNRLDELVGAATSLRVAFEESESTAYQPALAALFILEGGAAQGRTADQLADRLRRLINHEVLQAACLLVWDQVHHELVEPDSDLSFERFAAVVREGRPAVGAGASAASDRAADLGRLLSLGNVAGVIAGITSNPAGLSAAEAARIARRRAIVRRLQELAVQPTTSETVIHRAIDDHYWLFGGQYVGIAPRRDFALLDQHDFPLLCADGSLHIVELKGPQCPLVRRHRNHFIVANEVHEATSQCLNYLRSLDEQGPMLQSTYRNELGIEVDFRRARGSVIIGHPEYGQPAGVTRTHVEQTIRSYNAHLARIQVLTYADLFDAADRALRFDAHSDGADESTATAGQPDR